MTVSPSLRTALINYLARSGWEPPREPGPSGSLWTHEGSHLRLPVPHELSTEDVVWQDILRRIAEVEGVAPGAVGSKITLWSTDVTNLRAANDIVIADTIPFDAGVVMLQSAHQMYRTCATTSLGPKMAINGNYRKIGDQSLSVARMAHTQRGSYIVPIHMPLGIAPQAENALPGTETAMPEPIERRISRTFAEALTCVENVVVRPGAMPKGSAIADLVNAGVSREFLGALGRVLSEPSVAEFSADFTWAPGLPAPASIPSSVVISAEASHKIIEVSSKMRPSQGARPEIFSGPIIEVHHAPDDPIGSLVVQGVRNARIAGVRVMISADRVEQALSLMRAHETVVVHGKIQRAGHELRCIERDAFVPLSETMLTTQ